MHVLFLLAQQHWTGAAEPTLQLARGLADRGWRSTVGWTRTPPGSLEEHVAALGLAAPPGVEFVRKGFHPLALWRDVRRLRQFVAQENVDIVFCNQSHDHWLGWRAAQQARRPVLARQVHASRQLAPRPGRRWLFRRTDALVVASRRWKDALLATDGLPAERVFVLPPAVDTDRFSPAQNVQAIRAEIGAAPDDRLIGLVSRIKAGRGHDLALAAFGRVRERLPNARLLFIGHGEGQAAVEAAARATAFADRVHFLGYRRDDLPAATAALDVALLLGEGADGACRAALEAMACGVPVAALRVGALTETLLDGETGRFVEPDADALAAGILEILAAPAWRRQAREHAVRDLSLARRLDAAAAMFGEMAARR
jgi:glycosyltransferase involved in cell wall biosynthesis